MSVQTTTHLPDAQGATIPSQNQHRVICIEVIFLHPMRTEGPWHRRPAKVPLHVLIPVLTHPPQKQLNSPSHQLLHQSPALWSSGEQRQFW